MKLDTIINRELTTHDSLELDVRELLSEGLLLTAVVILASPILFAIVVSTQSITQIYDVTNVLPGSEAITNYRTVLVDYNMLRYIFNSFVMAVIVVIAKIALSLLAALALVYYNFRFENLVFMFILFTLMLPVPVRIVPLFELMVDMGWSNTLIGLTGPYIASATAVFLLRQHFRSLPESYAETARLDDVGPIQFLIYVLVPMSRGMITGLVVITFISTWNQYLWPLIVISDNSKQVAQVGLKFLQGAGMGQTDWGLIMAGAVLTLIPPLCLLVLFRNQLLKTFGFHHQ
jgi:sn-glycerol 3-phosphate transport system permease protein